ncbi:uncharacterized protein LOC123318361 [Coccinella septempunctata]|uniref:uncharacterized protein LOC123318361 n=1 Tax=Coccinella septempunctata TaxID=41139 RepID=UPI001D07B9F1|nr:uncharacterized protein LOC123318361 [Coccinella septempunctata]
MKVFACITIALCVALAAAENEPKTNGKFKRYAPFLPNGIESKLSYTSIPHSLEYSNNLQRIYSGYSPNLAYSNIYGYGSPSVYSSYGSGISSNLAGLYGINGLAQSSLLGASYGIPSAYSSIASAGLGASYGASYGTNYGTTYGTPQVFQGPIKEGGSTQNVQVRTITQQVPVPVPQPYPVEVTKPVSIPQPYPVDVPKPVPVPVKVEVPVEVPRPYAVKVAQPVPVQVPVKVPVEIPRPYPVTVTRTVPVPVEKPIYVKYPVQYSVPVPAPYPVEVPHPVPVSVPHPVVVKEPQVHVTKSTHYVQPSIRTFSTIQPATYTAVHPTSYTTGLNGLGVYSTGLNGIHSASYVPSAYTSGSVYAGPYSHEVLDSQYSQLYNFPGSYIQGKYLTAEKQYINAQPLNYLRSSYDNKYGLLKSYVPSVYGGYSSLKTYSPSVYSGYNTLKTYSPSVYGGYSTLKTYGPSVYGTYSGLKSYTPSVYGAYSGLKSYVPSVYGGYNGLKSYTSEYLKKNSTKTNTMRAVVCLALVFAVVAAEQPTESINNVADILKETTFSSSSTPSSLNLGSSQGGFSSGSFSTFGSQGLNSGSFGLSSKSSGASTGFGSTAHGSSILHGASTFGAQQGNSASSTGFSTLAGNAGLYKSNVYGLNSGLNNYGYLSGSYGLGNGALISGYSAPITTSYVQGFGNGLAGSQGHYVHGYENALAGSQGHISNVDTQHHVDTVQHKHINTIHTITKQVGVAQPYPVPVQVTRHVPVAHPYPVPVPKAVPVPYNVHVPVPVDKPYPVKVPSPVPVPFHVNVPVPVDKPYPVPVEKTVRVPVEKPVYIRVPHPVAVPQPQPVPVRVAKPVPVQVPTPVVVKVPEIYNVHKVDYAVAPTYGVHYDGVYGAQHQYGGLYGTQHHQLVDGATILAPEHHIDAANSAAHFEASNALAAQQIADAQYGSAATFGNGFTSGSYQIQPAQLVGSYQVPVGESVYGDLPSIVDAKYAFKRETEKKKTGSEEKKKL